ncbi:organic radical activating enzyme [Desulfosporosinus acidiphilus SJ4]|uniref:7-carboxy-7-deazaguanine synthase n=1 Tax=Desulfosporosinus acidiphilus (strain DSM 22704 / JCM 16185 / SJ4) TaxID=646529 RepID=I4D851_DESAJ|nr:7-carboxy-7-deazaguanine synthase QueE [Desulfosporosinus acidiphilus]AFM41975.1 organic radical activating enzyme [Desulfosporosinus acidiphilus SJ4]
MLKIPVTELFSSIQGEGPYVGARQIFLRLPKCNLNCPYCDTETIIPEKCRMESIPGSKDFRMLKNPIELNELIELLRSYDFSLHHSISITGGEPLLWADELQLLLPLIREYNLPVYLETNGTLPKQLDKILPFVDIISMDIKLPFGEKVFWNVHEDFLRKSLSKNVFLKIVVDEKAKLQDLQNARDLIANVDPSLLTILQPVTKINGIESPKPRQILDWQRLFLEKLKNVRVIPQTHVFMGQL